MQERLQNILSQAQDAVAEVTELTKLDELRVHFLGKKGELTEMMKTLGKLSAEERPKAGQVINEAKQAVQSLLNAKKKELDDAKLAQKLAEETVDITLPGRGADVGSLHPVTRTLTRIETLFANAGFDVETGPEIEDDWHNFHCIELTRVPSST